MTSALWLADWSDSEDDDFRRAWREAGLSPRVVRSKPLGTTVGSGLHRLRSYPAYAGLAWNGLRQAANAPVVAWQPLAGALVGVLRRGERPPLVVLNPLFDPDGAAPVQAMIRRGVSRADRVVMFSRRAVDAAATLGIPANRLDFVPLGVRPRRTSPAPPGDYVVAVGRDGRDWATLAAAAKEVPTEIVVVGPGPDQAPGLPVRPPMPRAELLDFLAGAAAVVVPLLRPDRTSGQLAVLDAMSVGRAVVATRTQGTEDYVTDETGRLVPPGDPEALAAALMEVTAPGTAGAMGQAALAAVDGPFSLLRFVTDIDRIANEAVVAGAAR